MAGYAYPTSAYNSRAVSPREYEDLVSPYTPDGVIAPSTQTPLVYADSTLLGVKVRANRAVLIRGLRWESGTTEVTVPVAPNTTSGTVRKDLIVLRQSRNPWTAAPAVVQGAAVSAATATAPNPTYGEDTSTGVWELPLAVVTVPYNDTATDSGQCVPVAWWVGRDGQIVCNSAARPPHDRGRRIWEQDTGRAYISTGTDWLITADDSGNGGLSFFDTGGNPTGWSATLNNVRRRNGWVHLSMSPQRTGGNIAVGGTVTVGILGDGFRPPWTIEGLAHAQSTGEGRITVYTNGTVQLTLYGGLSKDRYVNIHPLAFPAA